MKLWFRALGAAAVLSAMGCVMTTPVNTDEFAKLSTVAVLVDVSVSKSGRLIDIQENVTMANAVAESAKARLAERGLELNSGESMVTVGAGFRDDLHLIIRENNESRMSGQEGGPLPPYFISPPTFQDKRSKLTNLFQHLSRPVRPAPEMGEIGSGPREAEQGSYSVPSIKDLSLQADAALIVRMNGEIYSSDEKTTALITDMAVGITIGLLTGMTPAGGGGVNDSATMGLYLIHAKTGEVLWTGTYYGSESSAENFTWQFDKLLGKLPALKKRT